MLSINLIVALWNYSVPSSEYIMVLKLVARIFFEIGNICKMLILDLDRIGKIIEFHPLKVYINVMGDFVRGAINNVIMAVLDRYFGEFVTVF